MTIRDRPCASRRLGTATTVAVTAMLVLAGCASGDAGAEGTAPPEMSTDVATPTPSPMATFASNEEALAAGVAAAQRSFDLEVSVMGHPGDHTAEFESVATGEYLESLYTDQQRVTERGYVYEGRFVLDPISLQSSDYSAGGARIVFYACFDKSGARRVRPDGSEVAFEVEQDRFPVIAAVSGEIDALRVESLEKWSRDAC